MEHRDIIINDERIRPASSNITITEKTDTAQLADSLPVISMLPENPPSISESSTSNTKETGS